MATVSEPAARALESLLVAPPASGKPIRFLVEQHAYLVAVIQAQHQQIQSQNHILQDVVTRLARVEANTTNNHVPEQSSTEHQQHLDNMQQRLQRVTSKGRDTEKQVRAVAAKQNIIETRMDALETASQTAGGGSKASEANVALTETIEYLTPSQARAIVNEMLHDNLKDFNAKYADSNEHVADQLRKVRADTQAELAPLQAEVASIAQASTHEFKTLSSRLQVLETAGCEQSPLGGAGNEALLKRIVALENESALQASHLESKTMEVNSNITDTSPSASAWVSHEDFSTTLKDLRGSMKQELTQLSSEAEATRVRTDKQLSSLATGMSKLVAKVSSQLKSSESSTVQAISEATAKCLEEFSTTLDGALKGIVERVTTIESSQLSSMSDVQGQVQDINDKICAVKERLDGAAEQDSTVLSQTRELVEQCRVDVKQDVLDNWSQKVDPISEQLESLKNEIAAAEARSRDALATQRDNIHEKIRNHETTDGLQQVLSPLEEKVTLFQEECRRSIGTVQEKLDSLHDCVTVDFADVNEKVYEVCLFCDALKGEFDRLTLLGEMHGHQLDSLRDKVQEGAAQRRKVQLRAEILTEAIRQAQSDVNAVGAGIKLANDRITDGDVRNQDQIQAVGKAVAKMKGDVAQIFEDLGRVSCRITDLQITDSGVVGAWQE